MRSMFSKNTIGAGLCSAGLFILGDLHGQGYFGGSLLIYATVGLCLSAASFIISGGLHSAQPHLSKES